MGDVSISLSDMRVRDPDRVGPARFILSDPDRDRHTGYADPGPIRIGSVPSTCIFDFLNRKFFKFCSKYFKSWQPCKLALLRIKVNFSFMWIRIVLMTIRIRIWIGIIMEIWIRIGNRHRHQNDVDPQHSFEFYNALYNKQKVRWTTQVLIIIEYIDLCKQLPPINTKICSTFTYPSSYPLLILHNPIYMHAADQPV